MLDTTAQYAMKLARLRAANMIRLFKPWPHVGIDDLTQIAVTGIVQARYDVRKASYATFCYRVAHCRILDYLDACKCRGVQTHLAPEGKELEDTRTEIEGTSLLDVAKANPFPRRGLRGRPWKVPLAARLDMIQRKQRGESWGSIALRYGVSRDNLRGFTRSVRRIPAEAFDGSGAASER